MIHVVTCQNQHLYGRQLDAMFRMRHAFYIEGHGWSGLTGVDGKETDEFDDSGVVYLMSIDAWGDVAASVRLNPTTGPTLLKKFAGWSDEALPVGEDCWDISRWIAAPQHRRAANARWPTNHQRELMVGILEFCQSRGLTRLTMLAELRLAERIAAYGWPLRQMGAPQVYEGGKGTAVAAEIAVGPHVLALTRQKTGVLNEMMFEIDPAKTPTPARQALAPHESVAGIVDEIGAKPLHRLINAIGLQIAGTGIDNQARAVELLGVFSRILEACGGGLEPKAENARLVDSSTTVLEHRASGI
jgi:acyl-homoserine lactone synthase